MAYSALLDEILEDRQVSHSEAHALVGLAVEWGLSRQDLETLHRLYLRDLARAAMADGTLSREEVDDLRAVADVLGVSRDDVFADLTDETGS